MARGTTKIGRGIRSAPIGLAIAGAAALGLAATDAATKAAPRAAAGILEVQVTDTPGRMSGQPVVAVNPRDPNNLVLVSTAHFTSGPDLDRLACFVAHSDDGGKTWQQHGWPYGDRPQCGDPYLAVDQAGTFFLAYNRLGCPSNHDAPMNHRCPEGPGQVGVSASRDGGKTWSAPVSTTVARTVTPRLRVDAATGYVYVVGGIGTSPSDMGLAVSEDHGVTWKQPARLPAQPFGNQIAVHDGVIATGTAMKVVAQTAIADQVKFAVSTDGGQTFASHVVTDSHGRPAPLPSGRSLPNNKTLAATDPVPWISADPSRRGRFAVMLPQGDSLAVYVTPDSGQTWVGPALIPARDAAKPWIEYGPAGQLGVMWRTLTGDVVNVYATISFDAGRSFAPPLKVNKTAYRYGYPGSGGDEWSRIVISGDYAYVTWADARGRGTLDSIMARLPLQLYRRARY